MKSEQAIPFAVRQARELIGNKEQQTSSVIAPSVGLISLPTDSQSLSGYSVMAFYANCDMKNTHEVSVYERIYSYAKIWL
jgi:hypothetical protein